MRRAALIPAGYTAIAIADGDEPPLALVHADSFEVGRLVPRPVPVTVKGRTLDLERQVTDADLATLAGQVLSLLAGVGEVLIHAPKKGKKQLGLRIGTHLHATLTAAGYSVRWVQGWRRGMGGTREEPVDFRGEERARVAGGFVSWASDVGSVVSAGALLVEAVAPRSVAAPEDLTAALDESVADLQRKEAQGERARVSESPATFGRTSSDVSATERPEGGQVEPATHPATGGAVVSAPRLPVEVRMGIDPGSRYLALVIAIGTEPPLTPVYIRTFDVGASVALAKPKTYANGRTQTHRRSVTSEHMGELAGRILVVCEEYGVERVMIEDLDHAFFSEGEAATHASMATHLIKTAGLAMTIVDRLRSAKFEVCTITQASARAQVVGRGKGGQKTSERIPGAVREHLPGWPSESNEHERDAGVYLLSDCVDVRGKASKRAVRTGAGKGRVRTVRAVTDEDKAARRVRDHDERLAVRRAKGCTCPDGARRCRKTCPTFVAKVKPRRRWTVLDMRETST